MFLNRYKQSICEIFSTLLSMKLFSLLRENRSAIIFLLITETSVIQHPDWQLSIGQSVSCSDFDRLFTLHLLTYFFYFYYTLTVAILVVRGIYSKIWSKVEVNPRLSKKKREKRKIKERAKREKRKTKERPKREKRKIKKLKETNHLYHICSNKKNTRRPRPTIRITSTSHPTNPLDLAISYTRESTTTNKHLIQQIQNKVVRKVLHSPNCSSPIWE
jgi:hypothetical protein